MTDIAKLAIQAETKGVTQAQAQLDKLSTSAGKAEKSTKSMAAESGKAEKAANGMGSATRNLSFQLNQVAQQGAVTGNYLGALAVQLPDMLLSFGTLGILAGAAAGVMAGPLLTALSDTESQTADTREELDNLVDRFEELGNAQKELLRINLAEDQKKLNKEIREATGEYDTAVFKLDRLISNYERGRVDILEFQEEQARLNLVIAESKQIIEENNNTLKQREDILNGQTRSEAERATAVQQAQLELVEQLAALTLNNSELLKRELLLNGANEAEIASALHMQASIDKIEAETKALKDQEAARAALARQLSTVEQQIADPNQAVINAAQRRLEIINAANEQDLENQAKYDALRVANAEKLSADLIAIEERTQKQNNQILSAGQMSMLSSAGQLFGNLASIAEKGGKDQFQAYKNLASAQAAIGASLAIIKALAEGGPILGPILATSIGAVAAIQIAQIQAQEYQGARAMGGQVSSGNSYLVGENGPEIIHMNGNGSVQANHNLGGSSPQITNVFQISPGIQGTVQAEIMSAVPLMKKAAISAYNEARRKGQLR